MNEPRTFWINFVVITIVSLKVLLHAIKKTIKEKLNSKRQKLTYQTLQDH